MLATLDMQAIKETANDCLVKCTCIYLKRHCMKVPLHGRPVAIGAVHGRQLHVPIRSRMGPGGAY